MKKLIAFIGLFAMVFMLSPLHYAEASSGVTQDMINKAIEVNYGYDNVIILKSKSDQAYYMFVELNANKEYGSPYNDEVYSNPWRVNSRDEYNPIFVSPSYWHMTRFKWDSSSSAWVNCNDRGVFDYNVPAFDVVYASQNVIYGHEYYDEALRFTPFFTVAPRPTELAKIVEQSNRQRSPMFQVISLLPLGISLVVSFLALRKCLQMLRTILSGA